MKKGKEGAPRGIVRGGRLVTEGKGEEGGEREGDLEESGRGEELTFLR